MRHCPPVASTFDNGKHSFVRDVRFVRGRDGSLGVNSILGALWCVTPRSPTCLCLVMGAACVWCGVRNKRLLSKCKGDLVFFCEKVVEVGKGVPHTGVDRRQLTYYLYVLHRLFILYIGIHGGRTIYMR